MKKYLSVCFLVVNLASANSDKESADFFDMTYEEDEEVYLKVFGHVDHQEDMLFDTEVLIDGESVGTVPTIIGKNSRIQVFSLKECLKRYLDAEDIELINKFRDEDGFVAFNELKEISLEVKLNRLKMVVDVKIPLSKKKVRSFGNKRGFVEKEPNVKPSTFSSILNMRVSQSFNKNKSDTNNKSYIVLDSVINILGLCLEGDISYEKDSRSKGKFKRNYTTLVYDWEEPDIMIRYGDIFSRTLSYQSLPHVWGINIKKDVERERIRGSTTPIQITVLRLSTVEVYSNNHLIRTRTNVAPGTYILDDISYSRGSNDIKIKIIDETGREEVLDESFFFESSYVPKGKFVCSGTYGYPEVGSLVKGRYDKDNPVMSGFIKYGLLSSTEVGIGLLKNKNGKTFSYELRNSNKLGHFTFKFANSNYKIEDKTMAGKVFYALYSSPSIKLFNKAQLSVSASFEKKDKFFKPYLYKQGEDLYIDGFIRKEENERGQTTTETYRLNLNNIFSFNTGVSFSRKKNFDNRTSKMFEWNISRGFDINNGIFSNGSISASFSRYSDFDNRNIKAFSIYCSISLKDNVSLSSGYSKSGAEFNQYVSAYYSPAKSRWNGNVSFNRSRDVKSMNVRANYQSNKFAVSLDHLQSSVGTRSSRVSAETAVYFADGRFAVSKRSCSEGGFVIVTPNKDLKEIKFLNKDVESGVFGRNAVLNASRFSTSESRIDLREIPDDIYLKQDTVIVKGQYKRGFIADIEGEKNIAAKGIMVDSGGEPLKKVTGFAINKDNTDRVPVSFFTNDEGEFYLYDIKPGNYKLTVNIIGTEPIDLKIKDTGENLINLKTVICRENGVGNNEN